MWREPAEVAWALVDVCLEAEAGTILEANGAAWNDQR